MIKPTIGRVVWFQPTKTTFEALRPQPYPALICHVHSDNSINVGYFTEDGTPGKATMVKLVQEGDDTSGLTTGGYAEWMPYQLAQAATPGVTEVQLRSAAMQAALATFGACGMPSNVLAAAKDFEAYLSGKALPEDPARTA